MAKANEAARRIAEELGIGDEEIAARLQRLEFTDADLEALAEVQPLIAARLDELVNAVGKRLTQFPVSPFADPVTRDFEQQKAALKDYLRGLATGCYDTDFVRGRLRAGIANYRAGLPAKWFITTYSWNLVDLIDAVLKQAPDVEQAARRIHALTKIILFDLSLVLETYFHVAHRDLERAALQDLLTGLPRAAQLRKRLEQRLSERDTSAGTGVLFIGLNRFKAVNGALGHQLGDQLLKQVANRLLGVVASGDMVARLGGDIFVVLTADTAEPIALERYALRIQQTLADPIELGGFSIDITATIGIATSKDERTDADVLMRRAESALYTAKVRQMPCAVFSAEMGKFSTERLALLRELRAAIDKEELVLYYQPKIDLATGKAIGAEALIRWIHPARGFIPPVQFIPLAEETELIHPLTDWVIRAAVRQLARWRDQGIDLVVGINLAAANLQNSALPEYVREQLEAHGVAPCQLELEITESGLMADPERAHQTVSRLRSLGVRLAIDDFGTGYSSLAYLKTLPVHEVKVDRMFVGTLAKDEKDERIVRAAIALAKGLGMEVTAEGVEDQVTYDKLKALCCDRAQGFFMARPMPADQLEKWLVESPFGIGGLEPADPSA